MRSIRVALAQINTHVGNLEQNFESIRKHTKMAIAEKCDIVAFPELALPGYPPEDLLLRPEFIDDNLLYLEKLLPLSRDITIVVGFVDRRDDIFNAAAVLHNGKVSGVYHKQFLPNYSVFDENRYFQEGREFPVFHLNGIPIGINICEDIWYPGGPTHHQALYGNAEIIINISASPYTMDKIQERNQMLAVRARDNAVIVAYVNLVGGQDDLIFDGSSIILSEEGDVIANATSFTESLLIADLQPGNVFTQRLHDPRRRKQKLLFAADTPINHVQLEDRRIEKPEAIVKPIRMPDLEHHAEIYEALKLGVRDYVHKNGFSKVVIGLSGGIDSALVCAVAADALGGKNVTGISMPSHYTSDHSKTDARELAENFAVNFHEVAIANLYHGYVEALGPLFDGKKADLTEENLQARIRGNLLMAFSNKFGNLVLTTGNKSEYSVGYCTLYGDMVGALAVIKDVPKLLVYELCEYRNRVAGKAMIPESTLTKAPSAELRPDQKDTDSLPPYDVLDPIVKAYVEDDLAFDEIVALGYSPETVQRIIRLTDINEYKRRQSAPGIKVTGRAFGKDRRFPVTNGYRHR